MADTKLAKVGITPKGAWVSADSYEMLDMVLYAVNDGGDGCSYTALKPNQGVTPGTDDTVWLKSTQAGQSIYDLAVKYKHFEGTEAEFEAEYQAVLQAAKDAAAGASAVESAVEAAESQRVSAESARAEAEVARASAETARQSAEASRASAEAARASAESGRASAETSRATAEVARQSAETTRQNNETERESAELSRAQQFGALQTDMETAIRNVDAKAAEIAEDIEGYEANEAGRVSAENARASAESARVSAESARVTAETARETAETARVTAETGRVSAEAARETQAASDHTQAASDHSIAAADHAQAAADHNTAASDHTTAAADHTTALADHEVMEGYDTRLGDVESEVSQLSQEVTEITGGEVAPSLSIERGAISSQTGANSASTTRLRTSDYITADGISVATSGNKVYVMGYKEDGTFIGADGWLTSSQEVRITGATKYRLVFAFSNDATINVSDFDTLGIAIKSIYDEKYAAKAAFALTKEKVNYISENTGNLVQLQNVTRSFQGTTVETSSKGRIKITGTANASGGRTNKQCLPFFLPAGNYRLVLSPLPAIDVFVENVSGNAILASKTSPAFTLSATTDVYIGVNTVNGTTYSDDFGIAIYSGQTKTKYLPTITAEDSVARNRVSALENEVANLSQLFDNIPLAIDANGWEIPTTGGMVNALKKAAQATDIVYNAKSTYPSISSDTGGSAGQHTGFPYSSTKEIRKYIGWEVSQRTFMTAVNNPYSLFYTENISAARSKSGYGFTYSGVNCGSYYGMVCSIFAEWALGFKIPYETFNFAYLARIGKLVKIADQSAQGVHICDLLWQSGHTMLVTGVQRDQYGNVINVITSESKSNVKATTRTAADFNSYLSTNNCIIYRPTEIYKNTEYSPSEFVAVRGESSPAAYAYNDDICFFAGDYAAWRAGEDCWLNYTKDGYSSVKIYKGDTLIQTVSLDADATVHKLNVSSYMDGAGKYKACLTDGTTDSDYTYWELVDTTVSYANGRVSFASTNGTPWWVQICSSTGVTFCFYEITDGDIANGYADVDFAQLIADQEGDATGTTYLRVMFKADYGGVASEMQQVNL